MSECTHGTPLHQYCHECHYLSPDRTFTEKKLKFKISELREQQAEYLRLAEEYARKGLKDAAKASQIKATVCQYTCKALETQKKPSPN